MKNSGLLYRLLILFTLLSHKICCFAYDNMELEGLIYGNFYYNTGNPYGLIDLVGYTNVPEDLTIPSFVDYKYKLTKRNCYVETIGNNAFKNCTKLKRVSIPSDYISSGAFENCTSLQSVFIGCKNISSKAFSGCVSLDSIYWAGNDAPNIEDDTFEESTYQNAKVYVPWNRINSFKNNEIWSKFKHLKTIYLTANIGVSGNGRVNVDYTGKTMIIANENYVEEGSSAVLQIIPNDGYHLKSLTVGGIDVTSQVKDNQYVINKVSESMGIYATFEYTPNTIELSVSGNGYVECIEKQIDSASGYFSTFGKVRNNTNSFAVREGFSLFFRVYPDEGNIISKVIENGTDITSQITNPIESSNIALNAKLEITFEEESNIISFEDKYVKEICVKNWDKNGSGSLSEEEAALVTDIGTVFNGNTSITSFDELKYFTGISTIPSYAFKGCTNLERITFPVSLISIDEEAFYECRALSGTLSLPNSLKTIGTNAFFRCTKLTGSLTIPNSVTSIGEGAFYQCTGFSGMLTLPESITSIGAAAFYDCKGFIGSLTLPNTISKIGEGTFLGCNGFTGSLTIPNSVTSIENDAFRNCTGFTGPLTIPNSVKSINIYAFYGCRNIQKVISQIQSPFEISTNVFEGISSVAILQVPYGTSNKYQNTSGWINNFVSIVEDKTDFTLLIKATGNGVASYSETTIRDNTSSFTVESGTSVNISFLPDDGYRIKILKLNEIDVTSSLVNNQFTINDINADISLEVEFEEAPLLISFVDANVKAVCVSNWDTDGDGELSEKEANQVSDIGTVFRDNTKITSFNELSYFTGIEAIPSNAFNGCTNLEEISLPSTITSIGNYAFSNCRNLKGTLTIPNSVTSIGERAFEGCSGFTGNLTIPNSVTSIGWSAFSGCSGFTGNLTIPNSVTSIGGYAFSGCSGFTGNLTVPDSVTSIGSSAFEGCCGLTSIKVGFNNSVYDSRNDCNAIIETSSNTLIYGCQNTVIPSGVLAIGSFSFSSCSSLTRITIPEGVTSIGNCAFEGCYGLTSNLTIPNSVTTIGIKAFKDCSRINCVLSQIQSPFLIGEDVFEGISSDAILQVPKGTKNEYQEFSGWTKHFKEIIEDIKTYTLSITATGNGSVYYNNEVIRGTANTFEVEEDSTAIIRITADEGYRIKSLKVNSEDVTSIIKEGTYTISGITTNTIVEVIFEAIPTYTVSILAKGYGNVEYNGTVIRNQSQSYSVREETTIYLSLAPDKGYHVAYVKINKTDVTEQIVDDQLIISNISSNTNIEVEFEVTTPTSLNLNIKASGNGFAIYNDSIIRSKTSTFEVPYGEDADVSFMADDGYKIKSVMLNGTDVTSKVRNNQYTIANITVDTSLEVEFEIITYTLTITSKGNGNVNYDEKVIRNQSQNYSVRNDDSITLLLIPDKGYRVASAKVNNIDITSTITDDKLTLSHVSSNMNIEVEFEAIPPTNYTLTIKSTGNGLAIYNGTSVRNQTSLFTVTEGSDITISFIPDNGYRIKSVKLDGQEVTSSISNSQYTFIKIGSDKRLEVEFEEIPPTTYTLSITAKGNGSVGYEDTTTRNKTNTFTVLAGTSIPVAITPDEGYRIKEVKLDGADVTNNVFNNQYTIVNITQNTALEVEFVEDVTEITFKGVNYKVVSYTDATLNVASGDYEQTLTIPVSISAKNRQWKVVGVETNALSNCTDLAAIEWYPNVKFEGSVSNPNLLLYVSDKQYAGDGIQNVVVNNTAENIVLVDATNGNNFYCPRAFTANSITYEHSYSMKSGYNTCQGWETLVLPFDVTKVLRQSETELVPYDAWKKGSNQRPFWLYSLTEIGWKAENSIAANTPYIIGMPNNEMYDPSYNVTGKIQFVGTNVQVKVSDNLSTGRKGGRTLMPNYQNRAAAQDVYALNVNNQWSQNATSEVEGSVFVSALRNIHPFEAYMTAEGAAASMRMIPIFENGETTGIININNDTTDKHYYSLDGKPLAQPQKGLNLVLMRDGTIRKIVIK